MTDATILESLRQVEHFRGMAEESLTRLAEISRPMEFPARSSIFREHDLAKDVYVIIQGRVSLVICAPKVGCRQLMEVGDGELIGWSPLVERRRLSDTAYTLTTTKVLAIDGERVLALCRKHPEFGFEFMHRIANVLAQRLSATRSQLMGMSGMHLPDVQIESD